MTETVKKTNPTKIPHAVFVFSLPIILINTVALIFPSLLVSLTTNTLVPVNPFELGEWAIPVIAVNVTILIFAVLWHKNVFPASVSSKLSRVGTFEISKNVRSIIVIMILFTYVGYGMADLTDPEEETWGDFVRVKEAVVNWPGDPKNADTTLYNLHVKNFFLKISALGFDNYKITPFAASAALLLMTYVFTAQITHKRLSGVIAMAVLAQSKTFLEFDTLATYSNFWVLFYLISLYMIQKRWQLSGLSFIASVFSKPLTALYLPFTLFFTYRAEISKKQKIYTTLSYVAIAAIAAAGVLIVGADIGGGVTNFNFNFNDVEFWEGFSTWPFQLREDGFFLVLVLPVTVSLFIMSRKGVIHADSVLLLMSGIAFSMPLMSGLTTFNLHPYRYVIMILFFAIAVGMLFSQKRQLIKEA